MIPEGCFRWCRTFLLGHGSLLNPMRSRSLSLAITVAMLVSTAAAVAWSTARVSGDSWNDESQRQDSTQQRRGKNGTPTTSGQRTDTAASPADQTSAPDRPDQDPATYPGERGAGQDRTTGKASERSAQAGASPDSGTSAADPLGSRSPRSSRSGPQ